MQATCPSCYCAADIEAFLVDADARRCLARLRDVDASLVRPVIGYLRLFKPAKRTLRWARAAKIVEELAELVQRGDVSRDERASERRRAPLPLWIAGIEHMLDNPPSGLPLGNHHYLRAVVWGLAEQVAASAEKAEEERKRSGRRPDVSGARAEDAVTQARRYAAHMLSVGGMTQPQHDAHIAQAIQRAKGDAA
jgi:hypothetical protein